MKDLLGKVKKNQPKEIEYTHTNVQKNLQNTTNVTRTQSTNDQ